MSSQQMSPELVIQQLLALPRKAVTYVKERLERVDFFDETKADLQKDSPWYQLGSMVYLYWIIVVITGVCLVLAYIPTTYQAYESIVAIKESVFYGIIRGCHKYGGDALIIAATLRVYRMWFNAEYKNRGEFAFILSIVILLAGMYSGLTGYLLIWNQRAYWATKIFATFPTYLDGIPKEANWFVPQIAQFLTQTGGNLTNQGRNVSQMLLGGTAISQATMTRFFSLHFAISLIALVVTELYFYASRAKRINLTKGKVVLLIVAIVLPAEMGSRANPEVTPLPILSDWYFLALYQLLKYMDPYWATIWTVAIPVGIIAIMFTDLGPERSPWKRPLFTTSMFSGLLGFIAFSALIIMNAADINRDPPWWYAQVILFATVGEFWHFALYRSRLVWLVWAVPNILLATWLFVFYGVQIMPQLPDWHISFPVTIMDTPVLKELSLRSIYYLPPGFTVTPYHKAWLAVYLGYAIVLVIATVMLFKFVKKPAQEVKAIS